MTAEGTAPNAVDAADMSAYTGVGSQHAQAPLTAQAGGSAAFTPAPVALVVARGKAAKRTIMAVQDAGMVACVACTDDKRADAALRAADAKVSLGEKHLDALYSNGYAVLKAAEEADAQVILLIEDAQALSGVDTFLARAAAAGRRVFTQLGDSPQLGWVLCTTDKTDEVLRRVAHLQALQAHLRRRRASASGALRVPLVRRATCASHVRRAHRRLIAGRGHVRGVGRAIIEQYRPARASRATPEKVAGRSAGKPALQEGVRTGQGHASRGLPVRLRLHGVRRSLMGSMGSVVGEKVTSPVRACHRGGSAGDHLHARRAAPACRRAWPRSCRWRRPHAPWSAMTARGICSYISVHHRSHHRRRHRVVCHGRRHRSWPSPKRSSASPGSALSAIPSRQELPEGLPNRRVRARAWS